MAQRRTTGSNHGASSTNELLAFLRQDELDYPAAALKFGEDSLPFLRELVTSSDENLAMKAAYLVGFIQGDEADKILENAANFGSAPIRVAAAFGAQKRNSAGAQAILNHSLEDKDPAVVKFGLLAAKASKLESNLKAKIDKISKNFMDETIKSVAGEMMKKMK
jgi:hypothetical protein